MVMINIYSKIPSEYVIFVRDEKTISAVCIIIVIKRICLTKNWKMGKKMVECIYMGNFKCTNILFIVKFIVKMS